MNRRCQACTWICILVLGNAAATLALVNGSKPGGQSISAQHPAMTEHLPPSGSVPDQVYEKVPWRLDIFLLPKGYQENGNRSASAASNTGQALKAEPISGTTRAGS